MFISIRNKILVSQLILTLSTVTLLGHFSYTFMRKYIVRNDKRVMAVVSQRVVEYLDNLIDGKKIIIRRITVNREFTDYHISFRDSLLLRYLSKFKEEFPVLSYIDEKGVEQVKVVNGHGSDNLADFSSDKNFKAALKDKNAIIVSEIFDSPELKVPVIRFYLAQYGYFENEFVGVIAGEMPVGVIKNEMERHAATSNFNLSLTDSSGRILCDSRRDKTEAKINVTGDTGKSIPVQELFKKVFLRAKLNGADSFVYCSPAWIKDWALFVSIASKDFLSPAAALRKITIILSLSIFVLGIILSILLAKYITRPIAELLSGTEAIANGSLEQVLNIQTHDEIKKLGDSFNKMSLNLQQTMVSKDYLNNIIEGMFETLIVFNSGGKIKIVNNALCRLLGYKRKELINREINLMMDGVDLRSRKVGNIKLDDISKPANYEWVYNSKSGEKICVILSWSVMPCENPKDIDYVFIARDIRERKRAERELEEAYDKLKELQSQLVQKEKMAAIGQLAGGVAHEINNPLTGVLNNVQLVKLIAREKKDFHIQEFRELLDVIEDSALRCKKITESLLDFSHISMGELSNLSLNAVIKKVYDLIGNEMKLQNIEFKSELQPDLPLINADAQLMQQVLINLVSNAKWAIAKKFVKSGGNISIKTSHALNEKFVALYISDNGIGIPPGQVSKIFEPFFTTKQVGEGTGLGLSVVYNIIKRHKGNIEVKSSINEGSTFKITLPAVV